MNRRITFIGVLLLSFIIFVVESKPQYGQYGSGQYGNGQFGGGQLIKETKVDDVITNPDGIRKKKKFLTIKIFRSPDTLGWVRLV
jgi:hypothetical protein